MDPVGATPLQDDVGVKEKPAGDLRAFVKRILGKLTHLL